MVIVSKAQTACLLMGKKTNSQNLICVAQRSALFSWKPVPVAMKFALMHTMLPTCDKRKLPSHSVMRVFKELKRACRVARAMMTDSLSRILSCIGCLPTRRDAGHTLLLVSSRGAYCRDTPPRRAPYFSKSDCRSSMLIQELAVMAFRCNFTRCNTRKTNHYWHS